MAKSTGSHQFKDEYSSKVSRLEVLCAAGQTWLDLWRVHCRSRPCESRQRAPRPNKTPLDWLRRGGRNEVNCKVIQNFCNEGSSPPSQNGALISWEVCFLWSEEGVARTLEDELRNEIVPSTHPIAKHKRKLQATETWEARRNLVLSRHKSWPGDKT